MVNVELQKLCGGLPVAPLPPLRSRDPAVPHAPRRRHTLTKTQQQVQCGAQSGYCHTTDYN